MFKFKPIYSEVITETTKPEYLHGYSEEEVVELKAKFSALDRRDKVKFPLTLEEQIIVFKMCRINRTEEFILQKVKPVKVKKEKVVKEKAVKAEKPIKVKKKTKKDLKLEHDKMMKLLCLRNSGSVLSIEEDEWLNIKIEEFDNEN